MIPVCTQRGEAPRGPREQGDRAGPPLGSPGRLLLTLPVQVLLVHGIEDGRLLLPLAVLDEVVLPRAQPVAVLYLRKDFQGALKCGTWVENIPELVRPSGSPLPGVPLLPPGFPLSCVYYT